MRKAELELCENPKHVETSWNQLVQNLGNDLEKVSAFLDVETFQQLLVQGPVYLCLEGDTLVGIIHSTVTPDVKANLDTAIDKVEGFEEFLSKVVVEQLSVVPKVTARTAEPSGVEVSNVYKKSGLREVGRLQKEQLIEGVLQDIVLFEASAMQPDATPQPQAEPVEELSDPPQTIELDENGFVGVTPDIDRPPVMRPEVSRISSGDRDIGISQDFRIGLE